MAMRVVTISGRHFPAWPRPGGLLMVDLRVLAPDGVTLVHDAANLAALGLPEGMLADADVSEPQGFALVLP